MNVRDNSPAPSDDVDAMDPGAPTARVEGLLAAVAAACECMVRHADLLPGLQAAVEQLGRLSGHDRAYVWELTDEQTACVCIAEWDAPGVGRINDMAGITRLPVADFMEVWAPLLAGQAYQSVTPVKTGANAWLSEAVANRSDVMVPILVGDRCWGCIGFDNCTEERRYSAAEIQALRGAAAAVSAAIQRSRSEAERLALESRRADEAMALNGLLEGVVKASRALLDAGEFEQGLDDWLVYLAQSVGANAAMLGMFEGSTLEGALKRLNRVWARDGSHVYPPAVPQTSDFVPWRQRLRNGESVWAQFSELQDPASLAYWVAIDCHTMLLTPVVCDGQTIGWLGFDWRERQEWRPAVATVLRTAADGVAAAVQRKKIVGYMLAEREQRIAVEQARADEAVRHAARIECHSRLLEAVALSTEILLAAPTPIQGIDRVLETLCKATGSDRVCYAHFEFTPADVELHGWRHITHEWNRPGTVRKLDTGSRSVPMRRTDGSWEDKFTRLSTTGWFRRRVEDLGDSDASALRQMGVVWVLRFAVLAGDRVVALLGFDYSDPFETFEDATIDGLQTVASAIADALLRQELETRALAAERARADESARLAALLTQVVNSSRTLIDAELQAFEPALLAWLGGFGSAVGAIRCTFYDVVNFEATGSRTVRMLAEWVHAGVEGSLPVSFATPVVIDPRGAEPLMEKLTSGRAVAIHTEDTVSPMREFLAQQGNATVVIVPLVMDGKQWGCLSFDHAQRREPSPGEFAVLNTAADTLAAILKRNDALRQLLAERDLRIAAEQARSDEAARHAARLERHSCLLAALAASAEELLACADPADCMGAVLARVGEVTHAQRVCLARLDWTPQDSALHGWQEIAHEWARPGVARQMDGPLRRFAMQRGDATWDRVLKQFANERRILVAMDSLDEPFRSEQLALGIVWTLCYPVLLEGQVWGLMGMDYATAFDDYDEADLAALQTVATTIADAMLRRTLEQRALATERARVDEAQALNHLLESVVQSSRELLDAPDFKAGLQQWLEVLARAVDADVAMLGSQAPESEGASLADWSVHWAKAANHSTLPVPATADFIDWHARLQRGEAVWAHREELLDPASVRYWQDIDCWTNLLMPVVSAVGTLGVLCFDWRQRREWQPAFGIVLRTAADSVAAAIQRHEATQALLAERERRMTAEMERADENARLADLLGQVVRSSRALIDAGLDGFEPALQRWLGSYAQSTDAIRSSCYDLAWHEESGMKTVRVLCDWVREGVGGNLDVSFDRPYLIDPRGAVELVDKIVGGHAVAVHTVETTSPMREFLQGQGIATVVLAPIFLDGVQWGCLSFDHAQRHEPTSSDFAVLQTAADTLSAILKRNEALRRMLAEREANQELERRALAAERARVDEAQALNHLLESVVQSSRELLDAPDFKTGLRQWLEVLARAVDADVALMGGLTPDAEGSLLADWQVHWSKATFQSTPPVPATSDFIDWHARLLRGEAVWAHREDLLDPASVRFWQDTNCWTNLLMPIVSASGTVGFLCFDWRARREWQPAYGTVLRTAADSVAAAIQRHEAARALLAERERRIKEEQGRVADLSRANLALRASLGALAETASAEGFLSQTLSQIAEQSGSRSAFLLRKSATSRVFQLVGHVDGGPFRREALPHHPQRFKTGYQLDPAVEQRLGAQGRLLWQPIDAQAAAAAADHAGTGLCDMMNWHITQGHAAHALHALAVGQRTVGLVGLTFDTGEPLSAAREELINALCQPMTLALELDRLARAALRSGEHAAVLTERNRMAREIHDGIAQSFLAIQMQIGSLDGPMQHLPPVARAMDLARHGLSEARRAVSALRPHELLNRELPSGLRHLLAQMTAGSGLLPTLEAPAQWSCLPPEVEDQLFRIAQEAASNVIKHALARQLRVELSQAAGVATMLVADDGVGFDAAKLPAGQGFGLESMRQRAQLIGARIQWLSQPGDGTQVLVTWGESAAPTPHPAPWASA